jgi:L-lactate dehydrogenase complex protein LldG
MSDRERERIFGSIRQALDPLKERTPYPDWDPAEVVARHARESGDLLAGFREQLTAAKGLFFENWAEVAAFLKAENATCGYMDPSLESEAGQALAGLELSQTIEREAIDRYAFGITPACGAIAETGSIIIRDGDSPYRLAALAPWIHIAVVRRDSLVATLAEATSLFGMDPSVIFATGPSKTADIEGILIEGVHGPGIQACLML